MHEIDSSWVATRRVHTFGRIICAEGNNNFDPNNDETIFVFRPHETAICLLMSCGYEVPKELLSQAECDLSKYSETILEFVRKTFNKFGNRDEQNKAPKAQTNKYPLRISALTCNTGTGLKPREMTQSKYVLERVIKGDGNEA